MLEQLRHKTQLQLSLHHRRHRRRFPRSSLQGGSTEVAALLEPFSGDVSAPDRWGNTSIHLASADCDYWLLKFLASRGNLDLNQVREKNVRLPCFEYTCTRFQTGRHVSRFSFDLQGSFTRYLNHGIGYICVGCYHFHIVISEPAFVRRQLIYAVVSPMTLLRQLPVDSCLTRALL